MGVSPHDGIESAANQVSSKLQALLDLERHSEETTRHERSSRMSGAFRIIIRPGNSSQRTQQKPMVAACQDISETGCRVLGSAPMPVGDVFNLEFAIKLPNVFARCVRCRLLREDAFECAFAFFSPVSLPGSQSMGPLDLDV